MKKKKRDIQNERKPKTDDIRKRMRKENKRKEKKEEESVIFVCTCALHDAAIFESRSDNSFDNVMLLSRPIVDKTSV